MSKRIKYLSYLIKIFVFSTPLLLMQSFPVQGQSFSSQPEVGFETEGQSELNRIVLPLYTADSFVMRYSLNILGF